jgi:ferric-dicitrate binding protein FerR (iron transport regulator)
MFFAHSAGQSVVRDTFRRAAEQNLRCPPAAKRRQTRRRHIVVVSVGLAIAVAMSGTLLATLLPTQTAPQQVAMHSAPAEAHGASQFFVETGLD